MSKVFRLSEVAELAEKYADYLKAPCDGGGFVMMGFIDWHAGASDPDAHHEPQQAVKPALPWFFVTHHHTDV